MKNNEPGIMDTNAASRRTMKTITHFVVWSPVAGAVAALILALNSGVTTFDWVTLLVMYVLTVTGVELGLHRYVSHRSFKTTGPIEAALIIFGSMASQGGAFYWASTHRRHHAFSDQEGDPHSPRLNGPGLRGKLAGMAHAHMGWLFQPVQSDWLKYVPDLIKDRRLFFLNQHYFTWVALGLVLPTLAGFLISGGLMGAVKGLLWGGLGRIFLVHHAVWGINSLCHWFGRRPYETREMSHNLAWFALPSLGGAWHNNHHAFPKTADNRFLWYQFDFCGLVVRTLDRIGWAWDVHYADGKSFEKTGAMSGPMSRSAEG